MKSNLDDLHLFCRIVETGALRAAAAEIGTDPSNVSRRLSGLEERLGVQLIARSRARSTTTDAGRTYYDQLKPLLERMEALEDDVSGAANDPRGTLRISAPIDFGTQYIGPWLRELASQSPRLSVDLIVSDSYVDFEGEGLDIAIRIGQLSDSALMARRIGAMPLAVVGAPKYLKERGTPQTPDDLTAHDFILYSGLRAGAKLLLTHRDGIEKQVVTPSRFSVNNLGGVGRIVLAGGGLHAGPTWFFSEALDSGDLINVLPDWAPPTYPVYALYAPGAYVPAKIRRFIDLAAIRMRSTNGIIA
ncbi:LysR family transcriptional regulator [Litoreibacter roseus]|nr:LysR family transcriptional regulator [Litoreibacter roseus]